MRCSSCEPLLDAYLEGTLPVRQARGVASHLRACPGCAALLQELRVVDALLTTARAPGVGPNFTARIVAVTKATQPRAPRRASLGFALLLYVTIAWVAAAIVALRVHDLAKLPMAFAAFVRGDLAAIDGAARALAPATPVAAAVVTAVLMLDLLLVAAIFYGYRRLRPLLALYLERGPNP